jgi:hypothetical protein
LAAPEATRDQKLGGSENCQPADFAIVAFGYDG